MLACPAYLHSQFTSLTVHRKKWYNLPAHKHQRDWAEEIVPAGSNPPPSFLFFVVSGSLVPLFITCGQMAKLKSAVGILI